MAHGRTELLEGRPEERDINGRLDGYLGDRLLAHWEQLIRTDDFARRAREDVESVLTKIHDARPEPKEPLFISGLGQSSATAVS